MSSIIKVDQIQLTNGSTPTVKTLGINDSGGVLQIVQAVKNNETSTSSTSFVDTGLSKSITPRDSNSKILITVDMPARSNNSGVSLNVQYSTNGGSSYSDVSIAGNTNNWAHAASYTAGGGTANWGHVTKNFIHSPSTASTITYKVQYKAVGTGSNCIICDSSDAAMLTLTEIAG